MERNRRGRPRHPHVLTPAEWRVLDALREGGTNAEIAARLGLSADTVKTHISNMLAKLELRDRRALAAWHPDAPRRRLGGVLALPAVVWSLGRPLAWVGVGAAVLAGVVVVAVALVALEDILERATDPPAAVTPPSPTPTPTPTPTVAPTATPSPMPSPSPTPEPSPTPTPTPESRLGATFAATPTETAVGTSQTPAPVLARLPPSPMLDTPQGRYTAITAGEEHACALDESGAAMCWSIWSGAVWDTPTGSYTHIRTTGRDTCAITEAGEIVCWAVGGGSIADDFPDPSRDAPPGRYSALDWTGGYGCALTQAGELVCWGHYSKREREQRAREGDTDARDDSRSPVGWMPEPPSGPFRAIAVGYSTFLDGALVSACAARPSGGVVCWQSSGKYTPDVEREPWEVDGDGSERLVHGDFCRVGGDGHPDCHLAPGGLYTAISDGYGRTCGITPEGSAHCWASGQDAWERGALRVVIPPDPLPGRYVAISTGWGYVCALTEVAEAVCWGSVENSVAPPEPPPGRYVSVSDGRNHTCALTESGEAVCWGWNNRGQLNVPPGRYAAISAADFHTCALTEAGEASCWGYIEGQPPGGAHRAIQTGAEDYGGTACALTETGEAVCWGRELLEAQPPDAHYTAIAMGQSRTCALTDVGELICWEGHSESNTLEGPYTAIDVGGGHICTLAAAGNVACLGWDYEPTDPSPPTGSYTAIAIGYQHACALTTGADAVCWALPSRGTDIEPGRNPYEEQLIEPPPGPFVAISSSEFRSCAVTADGEVTCWGDVQYSEFPRSFSLW